MNRSLSIAGIMIGMICLVALVTSYSAEAQQRGGPQFEYMLLILDGDQPVAVTAEQRIEVQPPERQPSGRIQDPGMFDNGYSRRTIQQRHVGMGAMNLFGSQGWEAVGLMPREDGTVAVLLKR